jgi:hypothetical protein
MKNEEFAIGKNKLMILGSLLFLVVSGVSAAWGVDYPTRPINS